MHWGHKRTGNYAQAEATALVLHCVITLLQWVNARLHWPAYVILNGAVRCLSVKMAPSQVPLAGKRRSPSDLDSS